MDFLNTIQTHTEITEIETLANRKKATKRASNCFKISEHFCMASEFLQHLATSCNPTCPKEGISRGSPSQEKPAPAGRASFALDYSSPFSAEIYSCHLAQRLGVSALISFHWNAFKHMARYVATPRKDMFYTVTWNLGTSSFAEVAIWRWATLGLPKFCPILLLVQGPR